MRFRILNHRVSPLWALVLLVLGLGSVAVALPPAVTGTGTILVHVAGISAHEGNVVALLFGQEDGFPGKQQKALRRGVEKVSSAQVTLRFADVPFGTYAVALYHDVNGNQKLDSNWIGIPKEPVATSNDVKGRMGPPKFKDAQFELHEPQKELTVHLVRP